MNRPSHPAGLRRPRTRKTPDRTPTGGPSPNRHLLGSERVPPSPGRVGFDNMIPAPVQSVPKTDRWCLRLLTSMQRDCDTVNPLHPGGSPCGDLRVAQPGSQLCDADLENHSELENRDTRSVLSNSPVARRSMTKSLVIERRAKGNRHCSAFC